MSVPVGIHHAHVFGILCSSSIISIIVLRTFQTTSSIRLETRLKEVADGVASLKISAVDNHQWDGEVMICRACHTNIFQACVSIQYRLYRMGELNLLHRHWQPFIDSNGKDKQDHIYPTDERIDVYDAKIGGELKIVKCYRNQDVSVLYAGAQSRVSFHL